MPGQTKKRWANLFSRSAVRARENLGIIPGDQRQGVKKVREKALETYDKYYDGSQYDNLPEWDQASAKDGDYIPVRKRQPRIVYNFLKVLVDRTAAKLVGSDVFPQFKIEDDPDTTQFVQLIIKNSKLKVRLLETCRRMGVSGSALLRFYLAEGSIVCETYHSNYCYPTFKKNGRLQQVRIQYTYHDSDDRDSAGNPKEKWYRLDLTEMADILYDNPEYQLESDPKFTEISRADHNLGFVQGQWFRTAEDKHSPDGPSLACDVLDFIDEMNYSLSQSSQAVGYGQEPQVAFSGMQSDEIGAMIKSSTKAWNLGKDGKAAFVETDLSGVKTAMEHRDKVRLAVQDVARVMFLDPEKSAGQAQSGRAMEIMHGPMIELINELRPMIEDEVSEMLVKMAVMILSANAAGLQTDIVVPVGYKPASLTLTATWPSIFPPTLDDLLKKAQIAVSVTAARLLSEEWATGWLGQDVGVENIQEERDKIEAQPIISPFGEFAGGIPAEGGAQGGK